MALVGAGGKTSALRLLAAELAAAGRSVIATTTTAMFLRELAAVGPVVMDTDDGQLIDEARAALTRSRAVGAARGPAAGGKVVGLSPAAVDHLWAAGMADSIVVEADGSRGLPFKAFGPHEPQVPHSATTVIQVAGLAAIGRPLAGDFVHRAESLAGSLRLPLGSEVTRGVFVDGLCLQLRVLRGGRRPPRVVTLLNGTDLPDAESDGRAVAHDLLGRDQGVSAVVLASLRRGSFISVPAPEV